jgi:hypothetical protein
MDRYIWVKHADGAPFRKEINEKLAQGYKLAGTIISVEGATYRYIQPMIMPEKKWKELQKEIGVVLHGKNGDFTLYSRDCGIIVTNERLGICVELPHYAATDLWPLFKLYSEEFARKK